MAYRENSAHFAIQNLSPPSFHPLTLCAPTGAVAMFIWKPGTWSQHNVTIVQVRPQLLKITNITPSVETSYNTECLTLTEKYVLTIEYECLIKALVLAFI
jgi:hypothetical protein